jgi:hypothetical protein
LAGSLNIPRIVEAVAGLLSCSAPAGTTMPPSCAPSTFNPLLERGSSNPAALFRGVEGKSAKQRLVWWGWCNF